MFVLVLVWWAGWNAVGGSTKGHTAQEKGTCWRELTNQMWFSMFCTLIDNNMCHHSGQNVVDSRVAAKWVHNKFWPLWWRVSLSIRIQTTFRFVFYHNINVKESVFSRAWAEKGIAWHIDTSSVVWTLIDNGKLANQIVRLVFIVVKNQLFNIVIFRELLRSKEPVLFNNIDPNFSFY